MASEASVSGENETDEICLACGSPAISRSRRPLSTESAKRVGAYLKVLLSRRLHLMDVDYSSNVLDGIIEKSYLCKKCFDVYKTHVEKDSRLYEATGHSINYIIGCIQIQDSMSPDSHTLVDSTPTRGRNQIQRKRMASDSATQGTVAKKSPSVHVSV